LGGDGVLAVCRLASVLQSYDSAVASGIFAALVELTRLYHSPGLDAFRLTLAGKLLLGRVFSYGHFPVYWGAIGLAAWADRKWLLLRDARQTNLSS
jgi:hypothetical protein